MGENQTLNYSHGGNSWHSITSEEEEIFPPFLKGGIWGCQGTRAKLHQPGVTEGGAGIRPL